MDKQMRDLLLGLRDAALQQVDYYERALGLDRTADLRRRVKELERALAETVVQSTQIK